MIPFIDRIRARVDPREQVVSFAPQPVITEDNLVVHIETVLCFQVTDPRAATCETANFIQAIEQLTVTTLRSVIGGIDLESTLTSREQINAELRGVLDEAGEPNKPARQAPLPREKPPEKQPGRGRCRWWLSPHGGPQTARRTRAPFGASKRRARTTSSETMRGAPGDRQVARSGRE